VNIRTRVQRLEDRADEGHMCRECAPPRGIVLVYGGDAVQQERCPRCGRALTIIRVVEEDAEGEGDSY
jgi:ribosomal protein L37AE/L43A